MNWTLHTNVKWIERCEHAILCERRFDLCIAGCGWRNRVCANTKHLSINGRRYMSICLCVIIVSLTYFNDFYLMWICDDAASYAAKFFFRQNFNRLRMSILTSWLNLSIWSEKELFNFVENDFDYIVTSIQWTLYQSNVSHFGAFFGFHLKCVGSKLKSIHAIWLSFDGASCQLNK